MAISRGGGPALAQVNEIHTEHWSLSSELACSAVLCLASRPHSSPQTCSFSIVYFDGKNSPNTLSLAGRDLFQDEDFDLYLLFPWV